MTTTLHGTYDMPHTTDRRLTAPARKRFNCFVDDTALIAGLKKSTRDGIKKWVNHGAIQVYVPLHTLERLRYLAQQTDRPGRVSIDAREAIDWLDNITSDSDNPASKLVHLEAPLQMFDSWAEVEKFMLPETLLSMESEQPEASVAASSAATAECSDSNLADSLADLRMDALPDNASVSSQGSVGARTSSPISVYSATSPGLLIASPFREPKAVQPIGHGRPMHRKNNSNVSSTSTDHTIVTKKPKVVPRSLQPFFNHLLWRVNQGTNFTETMDTYILVTNDPLKQQIGQRFGIRCKRLEQLREIIAREDRDLKNRQQMLKKEIRNPAVSKEAEVGVKTPAKRHDTANGTDGAHDQDDDEDEIVFKRPPPKAPQAMNAHANGKHVFDPNVFGGRGQYMFARGARGMYRGGRGGGGSSANNRSSNNHHNNNNDRHFHPRNGGASTTPRQLQLQAATPVDLTKPIDPDSYSRPGSTKGMSRGGRRRLWEPT
ncbi:hypothetical protein, variant 5 [Verruconis gallopava]|uniref:PIN domain-containing protein n=1 Tax=Verruconis gallopava TaxID=253628 RepID=A0A0D2AJQ2_9PEZI|nr:uncharacterized protein PV09_01979 [Verruconis gallopava]XP_016216966.1 hypothetical protein, variant 1 [Verruconis gallopava]XP_016216967.1 hypothetical protein, variant 2 [Verruconis gallopava]XP_016216968.1 hypothetical protein, variant 3 [Verruconis gallopava]XP_016216969.1 hypothetical protein, variant 4 [Verruconis gallopava]XP_016216970.1 hypothetical protein, variant 5 [Verruconis gallopava]KIW07096.1 hypothetical protein PV09_01979 [Verruconis gallopava]KIW07097.1 hypothetical pr